MGNPNIEYVGKGRKGMISAQNFKLKCDCGREFGLEWLLGNIDFTMRLYGAFKGGLPKGKVLAGLNIGPNAPFQPRSVV